MDTTQDLFFLPATPAEAANVRAPELGVAPGSALPGDAGTWSIGDPNNPSRDDAMSGSEEAARNNAAAISRDIERVTAVWHGSECVALYFEGRAYRPR